MNIAYYVFILLYFRVFDLCILLFVSVYCCSRHLCIVVWSRYCPQEWSISSAKIRACAMLPTDLCRASDHCSLRRLRADCNLKILEGFLEILGEFPKALELGGFQSFRSLAFDLGHLQRSLDDLFLCVSCIQQHLRSLLNRNHEFPSASSTTLRTSVFVQLKVASVCRHRFCSEQKNEYH